MSYDGDGFCFQTKCPDGVDEKFCRSVQNWMIRTDSPQYTNRYCLPDDVPEDSRAPGMVTFPLNSTFTFGVFFHCNSQLYFFFFNKWKTS